MACPHRQKTVKALRAQRRESLVHEIVALKSYRDQLRATLDGIDAVIAAKNTRLAAHDAHRLACRSNDSNVKVVNKRHDASC